MKKLFALIFILATLVSCGSDDSSGEDGMVKIPGKNYYIDKTEVTVSAFNKCIDAGYCNSNNFGSNYQDNACNISSESDKQKQPANCLNWYAAKEYCEWAGKRLPTQDEWMFAARGGENYEYAGSDNPDEVAWYSSNAGGTTHIVGTKNMNGYGTYDMSGNVWEWTSTSENSGYIIMGGGIYHDSNRIKLNSSYFSADSSEIIIAHGVRCAK